MVPSSTLAPLSAGKAPKSEAAGSIAEGIIDQIGSGCCLVAGDRTVLHGIVIRGGNVCGAVGREDADRVNKEA